MPCVRRICPPPSSDLSWRERTWKRELTPDRLTALQTRTAGAADDKAPQKIAPLRLTGPQPVQVSLPALLEGTIEQPAQIHRVKFAVKANDRIAVEVETLRQSIPQFNPYLRIVSASGDEAFTNVHSTVNTCGDLILKQIQPKTMYSFPRAGEFILEIRDITHTYGGPDFAYRVLLRQQVPHMGEVQVAEEQINLLPGEATKVSVDTDQEEGFDGQIALTVEGLPEGVRAMMGTELQPHVPPPYNPGKVERFQTESQKATFLFVTDQSARPRRGPWKRTHRGPAGDERQAGNADHGEEDSVYRGAARPRNQRGHAMMSHVLLGSLSGVTPFLGASYGGYVSPKLVSLRLMPEQRTLHGKKASQQFLVLGKYCR